LNHSGTKYRRLPSPGSRRALLCAVALGALALGGCGSDMHVQPRYKPLDQSSFFGDDRSARPVVPDTVARGHLRSDELLYTGKVNGALADTFPFPITRQDLDRGRERYNIYCAPCHGRLGDGGGMIVERGFSRPPSYHEDRLRKAPAGQFFDAITGGFGKMYSYASRLSPEDRWRVVAYIRALQLSQSAALQDVPEAARKQLTVPGENPMSEKAP
jgi:mono/diheme cytochrome c family protein